MRRLFESGCFHDAFFFLLFGENVVAEFSAWRMCNLKTLFLFVWFGKMFLCSFFLVCVLDSKNLAVVVQPSPNSRGWFSRGER